MKAYVYVFIGTFIFSEPEREITLPFLSSILTQTPDPQEKEVTPRDPHTFLPNHISLFQAAWYVENGIHMNSNKRSTH